MNKAFLGLSAIFKRELFSYYASPLAVMFMIIFLIIAASFTIHLGSFFERDQADMLSLFRFLPWLCIIFAPALAMRVWAEDIRNNTLELLMTLPVTPLALVLGKFLALWLVGALSLMLTLPIWLVITYLGEPDHGMIISGYIGGIILIGAYLAITQALSIFTRNQLLALVPGVALCFLLTVTGSQLVQAYLEGWVSPSLLSVLSSLSLMVHYENFIRGLIDLRSILFFAVVIVSALAINWAGLYYRNQA